jgi:hypothetical protein
LLLSAPVLMVGRNFSGRATSRERPGLSDQMRSRTFFTAGSTRCFTIGSKRCL